MTTHRTDDRFRARLLAREPLVGTFIKTPAVQVIDSPGSSAVFGQVTVTSRLSVTTIPLRGTFPVFVTR